MKMSCQMTIMLLMVMMVMMVMAPLYYLGPCYTKKVYDLTIQ